MGAVATFIGLMNYSESLVAGFTFLSIVVTAANLPLYLFVALALFVLRRRDPAALPPMLWLAGAGGLAFTAFAFIGVGKEPFLWALARAATGLAVYFMMRRFHPTPAVATPPQT
jgi:APA family basic amino acid/polyamine antiporter